MNTDGGSAFPSNGTMGEVVQEGMSLRDYFAAKAVQAIVVSLEPGVGLNMELCAQDAYAIADAMLIERSK